MYFVKLSVDFGQVSCCPFSQALACDRQLCTNALAKKLLVSFTGDFHGTSSSLSGAILLHAELPRSATALQVQGSLQNW